MHTSFFRHPLWRKFHNVPIVVVCASDGEHRLRDAKALIRLRDFLPPSDSGICTYAVSTVHRDGHAAWPGASIPSNAGVVILGRPALFGHQARKFLQQCRPVLGYGFESDEPDQSRSYRTIVAEEATPRRFECPSFASQLRSTPPPISLCDFGLVYSGWQVRDTAKPRPVMLLAGTSTLGTWGAVKFVTADPESDGTCWQEDIQGIVRAEARNTPEAFDDVDVKALEMLSPCRIWMEGRDLPPSSKEGWSDLYQRRRSVDPTASVDLRMLVNGIEIMSKHRTAIPPLVLLAMAGCKRQEGFPGGTSLEGTVSEISNSIRSFLDQPRGEWGVNGPNQHIYGTVEPLIKEIRLAGGIAHLAPLEGDRKGGGTKRFRLALRAVPFFLPRIS